MANDFVAVADMVADAFDLSGTEISNILDATPLLARMPFVPSSNGTTHKYITRSSNPVAGWRAANAGRDFDHSVDTVVTATLGILDWSFAADKAVADAWRQGGPEAFIAREGRFALRDAMVKLEDQVLNNTVSSNAFAGLAGGSLLDDSDDAMVVNAGGTTADTGSSVWLIRVGDDAGVSGVYQGDGPGLSLGETIVQNYTDSTPSERPIYYTPACSWFGLQFGGTYSVSRIANLTEDSGKGLTDDLIADAYSLHPVDQKPNVIAMSRRSLKQLRSSRTATNATGAPAPFPMEWEGIPLVVTDQIPDTEALLTAA